MTIEAGLNQILKVSERRSCGNSEVLTCWTKKRKREDGKDKEYNIKKEINVLTVRLLRLIDLDFRLD